jgi:hypothetical protein
MTHDYKAALDWANEYFVCIDDPETGFTEREKSIGRAIIHALRIADRLMGEPSFGMWNAGDDIYDHGIDAIFKAMRDQMLKEIEDVATN